MYRRREHAQTVDEEKGKKQICSVYYDKYIREKKGRDCYDRLSERTEMLYTCRRPLQKDPSIVISRIRWQEKGGQDE